MVPSLFGCVALGVINKLILNENPKILTNLFFSLLRQNYQA